MTYACEIIVHTENGMQSCFLTYMLPFSYAPYYFIKGHLFMLCWGWADYNSCVKEVEMSSKTIMGSVKVMIITNLHSPIVG